MPMETITTISDAELKQAGFCWRETDDGVRVLVCKPLEQDGFTNGFSTRLGGTSPMPKDDLNLAGFADDAAANIHENRRRFLRAFNRDDENIWTLAAAWQVHSASVRTVRNVEDARCDEERCDALTTDQPRILLAVKTADCVPVILGDSRTGACAAVHAGWRGTVESIIARTLHRMREEYGTNPSDVRAAIGSAARGCCYEVGADVIETFRERFPDMRDIFNKTRDGHALIDLHEANRRQLTEAGVSPERIHVAALCTMCRTDLFFSYRREKSVYGRTGRLLSVIGKRA